MMYLIDLVSFVIVGVLSTIGLIAIMLYYSETRKCRK